MSERTPEEIRIAYQDLAKSSFGQIVLEDLREGFYDVHTYQVGGNKDDALFMEGGRYVVGYILHQIEHEDLPPVADNRKGTYL